MPTSQSRKDAEKEEGSGIYTILLLGGLAVGGYIIYKALKGNGGGNGGNGGNGGGNGGSATIDIYNPDNVTENLSCIVKNTGTTTQTFGVGCSVGIGANNEGCDLTFLGQLYYDLPIQSVTLNAGQSKTINFALQPRQYGGMIIVKVWSKPTDPATDTTNHCLDGDWAVYNTPE